MNKSKMKAVTLVTTIIAVLTLTPLIIAVHAAAIGPDTLKSTSPLQLWVSGSTTVLPISQAKELDFEAEFPPIDVILEGGGSGAGLDKLRDGQTDIAASSKIPENKYFNVSAGGMADLRIWCIAGDSVAIIVHEDNTWLTNSNYAAIADIFRSTVVGPGGPAYYLQWDDVPGLTGAPDADIVRYTRKMNDGTHECFNEFFTKAAGYDTGTTAGTAKWLPASHIEVDSNQQMVDAVAGNPNAIGYVAMGIYESNQGVLDGVAMNGVAPSLAHVVDGTYQGKGGAVIQRFLWYVTNGIPRIGTDGTYKMQWIGDVRYHPELYIEPNNYIAMYAGDFTGGQVIAPTIDSSAPYHASLPDYKVNFDDLLYFVDGYIQANSGDRLLDAYCDFDQDHDVDFDDLLTFVDSYITSPK